MLRQHYRKGGGPSGEIELKLKIDPSELAKRLAERNLPSSIFGSDKPVLELEQRRIAGNGSREPENVDAGLRTGHPAEIT